MDHLLFYRLLTAPLTVSAQQWKRLPGPFSTQFQPAAHRWTGLKANGIYTCPYRFMKGCFSSAIAEASRERAVPAAVEWSHWKGTWQAFIRRHSTPSSIWSTGLSQPPTMPTPPSQSSTCLDSKTQGRTAWNSGFVLSPCYPLISTFSLEGLTHFLPVNGYFRLDFKVEKGNNH